MSSKPTYSVRETLHRLLAAGSAVLVFALGLMAVSPTLHGWAHHSSEKSGAHSQPLAADHECAVVEFAHGLTLSVNLVAPDTVPTTWHELTFAVATEPRLATTRYVRPPGRAPPLV
jgi:hypothetical protein|uniref:hypothetical protein n=1 Tax=Cephaloticoccus sp. TaxID=1985742 RepID=UPI00404B06FE